MTTKSVLCHWLWQKLCSKWCFLMHGVSIWSIKNVWRWVTGNTGSLHVLDLLTSSANTLHVTTSYQPFTLASGSHCTLRPYMKIYMYYSFFLHFTFVRYIRHRMEVQLSTWPVRMAMWKLWDYFYSQEQGTPPLMWDCTEYLVLTCYAISCQVAQLAKTTKMPTLHYSCAW